MRRLLALLLLPAALMAQTTITPSGSGAPISRPGKNLGNIEPYGAQQLLKTLNYANYGYLPQEYWQSSWYCSTGGSQTTTNWYNSGVNASGYTANHFAGATYYALSQTGTLLGTGTISASTANTSAGMNFTLSPALSAPCTAGGSTTSADVMIVQCRTCSSAPRHPSDYLAHLSGTAVWSSDVSPSSANQTQSLDLTNGTWQNFLDALNGNQANTVTTAGVNSINFNGSYTLTYKAKCVTGGCTVAYSVGRLGSAAWSSGTDSPSTGSWTTYTHTFTAAEVGAQQAQLPFTLTVTGEARLQDADIVEGSTLSGNTTMFRDAVVQRLKALNPGVIRDMSPADWCTDINDMIQTYGAVRTCATSTLNSTAFGNPLPYPWVLQLGQVLNTNVWLDLGKFNTASDLALMEQYLNGACGTTGGAIRCAQGQTATWESVYAGLGKTIYLALGNELWNPGADGSIDSGNGPAYGYWAGHATAGAKGDPAYSSAIKLVFSGWASGSQAYGSFGWAYEVFHGAGCTLSARTACPDYMGFAPYTLNALNSLTDPFTDEVAEIVNTDSTSTTSGTSNMKLAQAYISSTYGVNAAIYEFNYSITGGSATPNQTQMNGISSGLQQGLTMSEHPLLMMRDSLISGPINEFAMVDQIYNGGINSTFATSWQAEDYMAAGPGQIGGSWKDLSRPVSIANQVNWGAIGNNLNLIPCSQASTPTFSYAGGQGGTIPANSTVPYVNAFCFSDGSGDWTILAYNHNESSAESLGILGGNAPTGTVTKTIFTSTNLTDNNVNFNINNNATTPTVQVPTPTTTSGTSYSIPAHSIMALTYTVGTPTTATPTFTPSTLSAPGFVTVVSSTSASTCFYTVNGSTPTTSSTQITHPVYVAQNQTLNAICSASGFLNSAVGTQAYSAIVLPKTSFSISAIAASENTVPFPNPNRSIAVEWSNVLVTPASDCNTYNWSGLDAWATQSAAKGVTNLYTFSHVPGCANAGGTQDVPPTDVNSGDTFYKNFQTAFWNHICSVSSPPVSPLPSSSCKNFKYVEEWNEFNTDLYWSGLDSQMAIMWTDAIRTQRLYCSDCFVVAGSASAGGKGFHTNGQPGAYDLALEDVLADLPVDAKPDFGSIHDYWSRDNIAPPPMVTTLASHSDATCTTGNTPNSSCYIPVITEFKQVQGSAVNTNPTIAPWAAHLPWIGTEGGFGRYGNLCSLGVPGLCESGIAEHMIAVAAQAPQIELLYASNTCTSPNDWGCYWNNGTSPWLPVINRIISWTGAHTITSPGAGLASASITGGKKWTLGLDSGSAEITFCDAWTPATCTTTTPFTTQTDVNGTITATGGTLTLNQSPVLLTNGSIASTPTFSPVAGSYATAQTVTISASTGPVICYNTTGAPATNGTTGCTTGTLYTAPVTVSTSETLYAVAGGTGFADSPVGSAAYVINGTAATPTFSPIGGTYSSTQVVTISSSTAGATICWTNDGSTPTANGAGTCTHGTTYSGTISVSTTQTLKAIASKAAFLDSSAGTATYTISAPVTNVTVTGSVSFQGNVRIQ